MADPNFPPNLDIKPLSSLCGHFESDNQQEAIARYGIAGRVWEASRPLIQYFSPSQQGQFDPPCPIFTHETPRSILELRSGQGLASLHLASYLSPRDRLVLTDLPNVIPLCDQSIATWRKDHVDGAEVIARPLAWGSSIDFLELTRPLTHIIACDLIYFPHLYPPLLYTLLQLTESNEPSQQEEETFGPVVILSYHSRTLSLEESFFNALSQYFKLTPVTGAQWEAKVYICRRWRVTEEWVMPDITQIMNGCRGIIRGRDFGLEDELFASLEW